MLSNSSFEKNTGSSALPTGYTSNFTAGTAGSSSSAEKHSGSYSLKISGDSAVKRYAYQTLNLSGKAGDVYSMGGWAKANAVANHSSNGTTDFKLTAGVYYTDGEYKEYPFDLNEYTTEWQCAFGNFVMEKDYNQILIYCSYNFNANTAYFDDMFLYRDTVQSYKYDKDGNVISTADYANQQSSYSYDGGSLSKMLNPDGTAYEYGYDSKNNLITSRSNVGVQYDITYDQNGNPTSTSISADNYSTTIQSGKWYYIRLKGTGKYLTADGDGACQSSFTGGNNQKWLVEKAVKGGYYLYPQSATDKGLNVANNTQDGDVTVATHSTADTQRFDIELQTDYTYRIIAKCSTDSKLVTVPHAATQNRVAVWTPQGELNANQAWYFEDASIEPITQIEDGAVYQLRARHSGRYVSVRDNATTNGTYLVQYAQRCVDGQKFVISKHDDQYYTLSPLNALEKYVNVTTIDTGYDCKYMEISDQQVTDTNLFKFVYDSQRQAFMISPKSNPDGECVAVAFSYCTDDASVVSAGITDTDNRYFVLEKTSDKITSSATYQNNGNYPHTVTDSLGNTTTYTYDTARGLQTGITDAKGNTTSYSYNSLNDRLSSVSSGNSTVGYNYSNIGLLNRIVSPSGTSYQFAYDSFGNTKSVSIGTQKLSENFYVASRGLLLYTAYSNGDTIKYTYDTLDRITEKSYNNVVRVKYSYDKFGNLYEKQDLFTNTTYRYNYDLIGRITGVVGSNSTSLSYVYDDFNRVEKYIAKLGDNSNVTEYIYGSGSVSGQKDGLVYGVKQNGTQRITYDYDKLSRLNTRTVNTTTPFVTQYGYYDGATTGTTTTLVKTVQNGKDVYEYVYDSVGNITQIKLNGTVCESYTYDSLNQLTSVTRGNDTYTYTYDNGGNIQSVTKNGEVIKSYGYTDTTWKDKLTSYNGESITYDQIGNPLQYRDGYNFTWSNGRQLTGITGNSTNVSFVYNADGLRTSKTSGRITTEYYWLEGVLLGQKTGNNIITYLYDENGAVYGMKYNDNYFYYAFNAQGDVVGIIHESGNVIARYEYDAWGNILSVTTNTGIDISQSTNHIANINPIRYRGYYYDNETGFYYLQSRYYDPITQRFLNADGVIAGTSGSVNGYNLFVYCFNNPVNLNDSEGNWPKWIKNTVNKVKETVKNVVNTVKKAVKKTAEKVKPAVKKVVSAFTLELGVGMGLKGGVHTGGVTVDAGMKSDAFTAVLNSEHSKIGQRQEAGLTVSVGPVAIGPLQSDWIPVTENDTYETEFTWINDASVLEFGAELYIMYGATFNLSIDLDILSEGVVMIFE